MTKPSKQASITKLPVNDELPTAGASVILGRIIALTPQKTAMVEYDGNPSGVAHLALQTLEIKSEHIGRQVTLQFIDGNATRPVITGILWDGQSSTNTTVDVAVDSDTLTLSAKQEIVLKCGKASITLKKNGSIVLRGTNVESRASGVNKMRGRAIQLN